MSTNGFLCTLSPLFFVITIHAQVFACFPRPLANVFMRNFLKDPKRIFPCWDHPENAFPTIGTLANFRTFFHILTFSAISYLFQYSYCWQLEFRPFVSATTLPVCPQTLWCACAPYRWWSYVAYRTSLPLPFSGKHRVLKRLLPVLAIYSSTDTPVSTG